MKKSSLYLALATLVCSCSGNKQMAENKQIAPLPANIEVGKLQDCTLPASFTPEDFDWTRGNLSITLYNKDLYDAVEIQQMQVGDTLVYDGNPMVVNKITKERGGIDINGDIEEGGCHLVGNEDGTYVARIWDDHATYTELGKAEVALAKDFKIIDCGEFPEEPSDTIRTGQKRYIENLKNGRKDFFQLNTRVTIKNGMITEIDRHWIP